MSAIDEPLHQFMGRYCGAQIIWLQITDINSWLQANDPSEEDVQHATHDLQSLLTEYRNSARLVSEAADRYEGDNPERAEGIRRLADDIVSKAENEIPKLQEILTECFGIEFEHNNPFDEDECDDTELPEEPSIGEDPDGLEDDVPEDAESENNPEPCDVEDTDEKDEAPDTEPIEKDVPEESV